MKGAAVSAAPAGGKMNHSILKLSVLALAIFVFTLLAWDSLASALPGGRVSAALVVGLVTLVVGMVLDRVRPPRR